MKGVDSSGVPTSGTYIPGKSSGYITIEVEFKDGYSFKNIQFAKADSPLVTNVEFLDDKTLKYEFENAATYSRQLILQGTFLLRNILVGVLEYWANRPDMCDYLIMIPGASQCGHLTFPVS